MTTATLWGRCREHTARPEGSGALYQLTDSAGDTVAIVEITSMRLCCFDEVDDQHARHEGEGCATAAEWRQTHRAEWPDVAGHTLVVLEQFRVIAVP